ASGHTNGKCSSRAAESGTRNRACLVEGPAGLSRGAVISAPGGPTMVLIVKKGTVPPTPHTEFYAIPKVLTKEEIHGSYGFSGAWSRKIHVRFYPTEQVKPPKTSDFALVPDFPPEADVLQPYHIFTGRMRHEGDAVRGRKPIVHGTRTTLSISKPTQSMPKETFFRNGERHEGYFVQDGEDLVGWEGALYPFVFDVKSHHGIAREIHTAPPMHQTFQSGNVPHSGFSLCSFVPVMAGWHPLEVPAPYAHFNVDSDELMFFCNP